MIKWAWKYVNGCSSFGPLWAYFHLYGLIWKLQTLFDTITVYCTSILYIFHWICVYCLEPRDRFFTHHMEKVKNFNIDNLITCHFVNFFKNFDDSRHIVYLCVCWSCPFYLHHSSLIKSITQIPKSEYGERMISGRKTDRDGRLRYFSLGVADEFSLPLYLWISKPFPKSHFSQSLFLLSPCSNLFYCNLLI